MDYAQPCAGHPRFKHLQLTEDVDGRDKPGHDGFDFLWKLKSIRNPQQQKLQKLLIDGHNFDFLRIFFVSEMRPLCAAQKITPCNRAISLKKSKTLWHRRRDLSNGAHPARREGRVLEAHLNTEQERSPRADLQSAPGRLRASFMPALRPVREVQSLDWDRWTRVIPVQATSQEAWPGAEPEASGLPASAAVERRKASVLRWGRFRTAKCGQWTVCAFRRFASLREAHEMPHVRSRRACLKREE
jgi:hypothetical protein